MHMLFEKWPFSLSCNNKLYVVRFTLLLLLLLLFSNVCEWCLSMWQHNGDKKYGRTIKKWPCTIVFTFGSSVIIHNFFHGLNICCEPKLQITQAKKTRACNCFVLHVKNYYRHRTKMSDNKEKIARRSSLTATTFLAIQFCGMFLRTEKREKFGNGE